MRGSRHLTTPAVLIAPQAELGVETKLGDEWVDSTSDPPTETNIKVCAMPRSIYLDRRFGFNTSIDATGKLEDEYTVAIFMRENPSPGSRIRMNGVVYRQIGQPIRSTFDANNDEFCMLVREL